MTNIQATNVEIIRGRTVIMFATVPWHWNWQRQHEWASRLAQHNQVIYISNVGVTNHLPLNLLRKVIKHRGPAEFQHTLSEQAKKNLEHLTPLYIPWHGFKSLNTLNAKLLAKKIRPLIKYKPFFWICTPSDTISALLEEFPGVPALYDIAMRFSKRPDIPARVLQDQAVLARKVGRIIYDADASFNDLPQDVRDKSFFIPQGVNESLLEPVQNTTAKDPLGRIAHPRLAYLGALNDSIDASLLRRVVEQIPGAHLIMIGPYKKIPSELIHDRISFTGPVNFSDLPAYLRHADVGLIPYKINNFTAGVFPTKFFEYLAAGLPVVSTNLPPLVVYKDRATLAASQEEFIDGIRHALIKEKTKPDIEFLRKNSWQVRYEGVSKIVEPLLT